MRRKPAMVAGSEWGNSDVKTEISGSSSLRWIHALGLHLSILNIWNLRYLTPRKTRLFCHNQYVHSYGKVVNSSDGAVLMMNGVSSTPAGEGIYDSLSATSFRN
ncbi:hypothetical protein Tco_1457190 [Tanacetum coccineum]